MKLVRTFGRERAAAHALIETLEQRGAVNTARVEPVVRRILAAVRKGGDRALLKYAAQFDRLAKGQGLLVSREEMKAAWEATAPKLQAAMMVARGNILAFAEAQMPSEWTISPVAGVKTGQIIRPLGKRWLLCPGRTVSVAFDAADDGYSCPGGRGGADCGLFAKACEGDDGCCVAGRSHGVLSSGRGAGDRRDGVWNGYDWRVDKIVGPGNLYVTAAKVLVSSECGIDMPAGPTEIIVTSETGMRQALQQIWLRRRSTIQRRSLC